MGLYSKRTLDNGATIAIWEITESEDDLRTLCSPIPNDELEELEILRSEARRKEKLAVRALLNELYPEKVYLGHHDNGKPYIQNCADEISISHTSRFAAIITHDEEDVGIDIECVNRDFSAVEKKALSEEEIDDLSDKNHNLQLAIYWCAKEAIYKRMSQRRVDFAEQIELEKFTPRRDGELEAVFIHKDGEEEEFELEYEMVEDHVMVWLVGEK
ncbi:MAG: 4'-phosphopantetheinyl transferase superfamily protein [Bacteroidales bacterium]|jgi:4'-phosphopantetheinyl transferase EntD|nr:4'-phosphopantetheinyl transferase superfamily protein [Bacteroidales bacterium]MBO7321374.1 4'-phosphopantetheinyl transferase superfamily protein [Bacteroidales bacterium]